MAGGETVTQKNLDDMDKYLKALNGDKCKTASGATQIKVGSVLLATLALVF